MRPAASRRITSVKVPPTSAPIRDPAVTVSSRTCCTSVTVPGTGTCPFGRGRFAGTFRRPLHVCCGVVAVPLRCLAPDMPARDAAATDGRLPSPELGLGGKRRGDEVDAPAEAVVDHLLGAPAVAGLARLDEVVVAAHR